MLIRKSLSAFAAVALCINLAGVAQSQTSPNVKKPSEVAITFNKEKGYRLGETVPVTLKLTTGHKPLSGKKLYLYVSENCKAGLTHLARKVGEYKTDKSGIANVTNFKAGELRELWVYFAPVNPPCLLKKNPLKNKGDKEYEGSMDWETVPQGR